METFALSPARRASLERLIDYAGLFPPAKLAMEEASAQYERAKSGPAAFMLGRFIVRAEDLRDVRVAFAGREGVELSVIAAPAMFEVVARARQEHWAAIRSVEVPLGDYSIGGCAQQRRRARLEDLPIYVELSHVNPPMAALAEHGLRAKLRCGGVKPTAYPSAGEVAGFIAAACAANVPFKATAGLHHPVRHFNEAAGVTMHGFLNLLAAAARAPHLDPRELESIVASEDVRELAIGSEREAREARERFVAFGSCSFEEPLDDLRALGILAP